MKYYEILPQKGFYLLAGLFILWGILGKMDSSNYTYRGFQTGDNNQIINLDEDGPAASAGFELGDVVITNGGIDQNDNKALSKRSRPNIGDKRIYVVDRDGESVSLELTFSELPHTDKSLNNVGFIMGLLFVFIGLFMFRKNDSPLTKAFTIFVLCFGFIFFDGPYLEPGFLKTLVNCISTSIVLLSFAFMMAYMLEFPPQAKIPKFLFIPALVVIALVCILSIVRPDGSGTFNMILRLIFGVTIIFYFLGSLITLIKKYAGATPEARSETGLNLMLAGALIGLLPIIIYFTASVISPGIDLPGNDYIFITFLAIPICFAMALNKQTAN